MARRNGDTVIRPAAAILDTCGHEPAVVEAVALYQWPDRCEPELRAHAAGCALCQEVADVAIAFRDDQAQHASEVRVPPADRVWLRAQLRARIEAAESAARPLNMVQAAAAAAAGGLAVGAATYAWPLVPWHSVQAIAGRIADVDAMSVVAATTSIPQLLLLTAAVAAAGILLMPVALYFVLSE